MNNHALLFFTNKQLSFNTLQSKKKLKKTPLNIFNYVLNWCYNIVFCYHICRLYSVFLCVFTDEESSELVTCFCRKPFGGRPMIECSRCLTWIHLSCAKIRKTNIPEEFICQLCRDSKTKKRKSGRMRFEKKMKDV